MELGWTPDGVWCPGESRATALSARLSTPLFVGRVTLGGSSGIALGKSLTQFDLRKDLRMRIANRVDLVVFRPRRD